VPPDLVRVAAGASFQEVSLGSIAGRKVNPGFADKKVEFGLIAGQSKPIE